MSKAMSVTCGVLIMLSAFLFALGMTYLYDAVDGHQGREMVILILTVFSTIAIFVSGVGVAMESSDDE